MIGELYYFLLDLRTKLRTFSDENVERCMRLSELKEEDLDELRLINNSHYGIHTFGNLILQAFYIRDFFVIMDYLKENCLEIIFNEIIDFDGNFKDRGHLLALLMGSPIDWSSPARINIYLDIVDRYYDGKYYMLCFLSEKDLYSPIFEYIVGREKYKNFFLEELLKRNPAAAQFDMSLF